MEELKLEDLNFSEKPTQVFDEEGNATLINQEKEEKKETETPDNETKEDKPTSGEEDNDSPESVAASKDKEKDQVQTDKTSDNGEGSNSSSPKLNETEQLYSNLAAQFKAKGVLSGLEDTKSIKSLEDLKEAMNKEVESKFNDQQKIILEASRKGAPVDEVSEKIESIDKLKTVSDDFINDEKNIQFRQTAIAQDFIIKGYSKERAIALAQRSVDNGTDIEDAKFALEGIIKHEESELQSIIDSVDKKKQDDINNIKNYVDTTQQILPDIELNSKQKEELYSQMTTDLGNNLNAFGKAKSEDPVGMQVKMEALFYLTDGFKNFGVFNTAESKAAQNIENLLRGQKFTESGKVDTSPNEDDNASFQLKDLKDLTFE